MRTTLPLRNRALAYGCFVFAAFALPWGGVAGYGVYMLVRTFREGGEWAILGLVLGGLALLFGLGSLAQSMARVRVGLRVLRGDPGVGKAAFTSCQEALRGRGTAWRPSTFELGTRTLLVHLLTLTVLLYVFLWAHLDAREGGVRPMLGAIALAVFSSVLHAVGLRALGEELGGRANTPEK